MRLGVAALRIDALISRKLAREELFPHNYFVAIYYFIEKDYGTKKGTEININMKTIIEFSFL